ncbi:interleukin-12 subunit beta isoform X1 [Carassius gibelio]|uniref:interleukin-12 subunit beta isoform X1 n=1 Tax=Carassius gibelio TaxID=101364 RepID=UPI002279DCD2|nr:interleukin-12 subunit beta isoform X1 [Carassius gibelio]
MVWLIRFTLLFCLCIMKMSALNFFPEKFEIAERHASITLTCRTDKDVITWRREDANTIENISQSEFEILSGRNLTVIDLQEDLTGNYTCWSDSGLEDYTYLLLDKSKETTAFNINCTAETFSCTEKIKCAWTINDFTDEFAFRLRNTRDNGDWVSQPVDGVFFLQHSTNSYSEESERMLITGEAASTCCYMKTEQSFYLRDIIKPANPNISICTIKNEGSDNQIVELEVEPPSTWPQPHSFFPLKHQIEYEIRHDGKLKTKEWEEGSKFKVRGSITKIRGRCRDLLLLSQWSEWSEWKNVTDGGKGGRSKGQRKKPRNKKKNKINKKTKQRNKNKKQHLN